MHSFVPDSARKQIRQEYELAMVRGIFLGEKIETDPRPVLQSFGLQAMPVTALPFSPAILKQLDKQHILSIDTLCSLNRYQLEALGMPPAYSTAIDKKLGSIGLRLGMDLQARAAVSYHPSEALMDYWPPFRAKYVSNSDATYLGPKKEEPKQPAQAPSRIPGTPTAATQSSETQAPDHLPATLGGGYVQVKLASRHGAEQFYDRANFVFNAILRNDPHAARICSSNEHTMAHPIIRLDTYTKNNERHTRIYPIALSPDMLHLLSRAATDYPDALHMLIGRETTVALAGSRQSQRA